MVERVLTRCAQDMRSDVEPLLILLRRFAAEAAREEARMFCSDLVADRMVTPLARRATRRLIRILRGRRSSALRPASARQRDAVEIIRPVTVVLAEEVLGYVAQP